MSHNDFGALGVPASLVAVLAAQGITTPTPIQAAALGDALAGRDVLGRGRHRIREDLRLPVAAGDPVGGLGPRPAAAPRKPRALILAPTRELATQIGDALRPLLVTCGMTSRTVFGGIGKTPEQAPCVPVSTWSSPWPARTSSLRGMSASRPSR